jgi:hypothetical protein
LVNPTAEKSIESNTHIVDEVKPSSSKHFSLRYGSAADIPSEDGFDLKSIVNAKPVLSSNDLITLLDDNQLENHAYINNNYNELLISYVNDRENLVQIAKQNQEEFINAINLD